MKLIGREKELGTLERFWAQEGYGLGVVYGRRRIGKSFLLKNFSEGKRSILLQATTSQASNLTELASQISKLYPTSTHIAYTSYEAAFDDLANLAKEEKLLVVLDEISFLEESNKDILSIMQKYADTIFQNTQLKIILCSSLESFMIQHVIGGKTPFFGRTILRLKVNAIKPNYTKEFFPTWSLNDIAQAYVITAGIPYYLKRLSQYKTFQEALKEEFFSMGGALLTEPFLLLYAEVRNVDSFMLLMATIAQGVNKTSKIADKTGTSVALCSSMLKKLSNLGFVGEMKNSVMDSKILGWTIVDNFFAFWFRFIYPAQSSIELDNAQPMLKKAIKELDEFTGKRIEQTIREYIVSNSEKPITEYGFAEFANAAEKQNEELDFIAKTSDNEALFGEFKLRNREVSTFELDELKRKSYVADPKTRTREFYLCSKDGFSEALEKKAKDNPSIHLIEGKTIFGF